MHLAAVGHTKMKPHMSYPPGDHPTGRAFSWERGRILQTLQIIAIRSGVGEVEWLREQREVVAHSVFIIKPGEWHRYRPALERGWVEDWLELRGLLPEHWLSNALFKHRFLRLENPLRFFECFDKLHALVNTDNYVPEGLLESQACVLIAEMGAMQSDAGAAAPRPGDRELVAQARKWLAQGMEVGQAATQLGVSYLSLYRSFKRCSALSPKQFAESARLAKAEAFLLNEALSVKEIAAALGYNSASHFSLNFKAHYGIAPAIWRAKLNAD
jgi:AraC-like DNA-binding protein